ncbi:hypothetical protein AB0A63_39640 [Lentzea sp. NPDC042327]|uniref:hypothetical protein n=1 Tax=Lentzea sp. NPDC042327 TaxID=3154801 RepID=UPI0033FDC5C8
MIRSVAALAAVGVVFALTPIAAAQEDVTPKFSLGGEVFPHASEFTATIEEGTCPGGPTSLTSPGFATFDLATLRGRFADVQGPFAAYLECKGTSAQGVVRYRLDKPQPPVPPFDGRFLDKEVYAPGETIKVQVTGYSFCPTAESNGFVAPISLPNNPGGSAHGEGKATGTPGTYEATVHCYKNQTFVNTFTVKAPPTTPTTSTTPPAAPTAKPKPPIVKPKGAPQTGGGGTA